MQASSSELLRTELLQEQTELLGDEIHVRAEAMIVAHQA